MSIKIILRKFKFLNTNISECPRFAFPFFYKISLNIALKHIQKLRYNKRRRRRSDSWLYIVGLKVYICFLINLPCYIYVISFYNDFSYLLRNAHFMTLFHNFQYVIFMFVRFMLFFFLIWCYILYNVFCNFSVSYFDVCCIFEKCLSCHDTFS